MAEINSKNLQWNNPLGGLPLDNGLYKATTDQKFHYGSRIIHPIDGRTFKYCHATTECQSGYGARNYAGVNISVLLPATPATIAAGTSKITITIASGDGYAGDGVIAEDELVGGYIVFGNQSEDPENRLIIKNTAVASGGGTSVVTIDGGINAALTGGTSYCEVLLNPYAHLVGNATNDEYMTCMCLPACNAAATYNFWGLTYGIAWITPTGAAQPGYTANDREVYCNQGNGAFMSGTTAVVETGWQRVGTILERTASATTGAPFVLLQLSA